MREQADLLARDKRRRCADAVAGRRVDRERQLRTSPVAVGQQAQNSGCSVSRDVAAAASHGEDRRNQGFSQDLILTEHYLLRKVMDRYFRRVAQNQHALDAILRIDAMITITTQGAFLGYHRQDFPSPADWRQSLERVVTESPLLDSSSRSDDDSR